MAADETQIFWVHATTIFGAAQRRAKNRGDKISEKQ
jgi:hypothetical protein